jgi:hypothetical protein
MEPPCKSKKSFDAEIRRATKGMIESGFHVLHLLWQQSSG